MPSLPSGTVAFLFTDIEGSTRLWEHDQAVMWAALAQHNDILEQAITTHGGHHFKTIGDAFQAAFATAQAAVAAAVTAQQAIGAAAWSTTGPLRVRMAIHIGDAQPVAGDYLAPCLNRLARLLGTGYGGQVLLSAAAKQALNDALPDGVALLDLGAHRLRDLLEAERVWQLHIDGLPSRFPPLKSMERHPTNLPTQPTPLVGRAAEIHELSALLTADDVRLVTITGPGGTGKTRLALHVAAELLDQFEDGAFLVDLAALSDPALLLTEVARELGVRESGNDLVEEALESYLSSKRLLLLLDNFEQILDAAPLVADWLAASEGLKIIVTSRAPLAIRGEREYAVQPLPLPSLRRETTFEQLAGNDAVALFAERASAALSTFALTAQNIHPIAEICVRLDGLPLAIELAAARIKVAEPSGLLARLDRRLSMLTGGPRDLPVRQRTLRATIAWSYDLLSSEQQRLFRLLAVFVGGAQLSAVEAIAESAGVDPLDVFDGVAALIDHSLVRRLPGDDIDARFTMLETLREFGLEQAEAGDELGEIRAAHARMFLELAATAKPKLNSAEQAVWLDRLEADHDNLRAGMRWGWETGHHDQAARIAANLWRFWFIRGHLSEGRRWLHEALDTASHHQAELRVQLMIGLGNLANAQGDYAAAKALFSAGLDDARTANDAGSIASIVNNLGSIAGAEGDLDAAEAHFQESLAISESLPERHHYATALGNLGAIAHYKGDIDTAIRRYEDCLAIWRATDDRPGTSTMLSNLLMICAPLETERARARAYGNESLALAQEVGDKQSVAVALFGLGLVAELDGNLPEAQKHYQESLETFRDLDDQSGVGRVTLGLGLVALDLGDCQEAATRCIEGLSIVAGLGEPDSVAFAFEAIAAVSVASGNDQQATRLLGAAQATRQRIDILPPPESMSRLQATTDAIKAHLAPAEVERYMREGAALSLDEMIELVSRELSPQHAPLAHGDGRH